MRPWLKTALAGVGILVTVALVMNGSMRVMERQRTATEINRLRNDLHQARASADRCRGSLQTSQASLLELGVTIDSLRNVVDSFETMDRGGVPAARYTEYLDIFDSYNDSVASWEGRERRLRASEAACRQTIGDHNTISDSLQDVLREAGIDAG